MKCVQWSRPYITDLLQGGSTQLDGDVCEQTVSLGAEIADDIRVCVGRSQELHFALCYLKTLWQNSLHGDVAAIEFPPAVVKMKVPHDASWKAVDVPQNNTVHLRDWEVKHTANNGLCINTELSALCWRWTFCQYFDWFLLVDSNNNNTVIIVNNIWIPCSCFNFRVLISYRIITTLWDTWIEHILLVLPFLWFNIYTHYQAFNSLKSHREGISVSNVVFLFTNAADFPG